MFILSFLLIAIARAYCWFYQQMQKSHPILQFQESEDTMPETSMMLFRSMLVDWKTYGFIMKHMIKLIDYKHFYLYFFNMPKNVVRLKYICNHISFIHSYYNNDTNMYIDHNNV